MGINDGNDWELAKKLNIEFSPKESDIWDYCPVCGERADGLTGCVHTSQRKQVQREKFEAALDEVARTFGGKQ